MQVGGEKKRLKGKIPSQPRGIYAKRCRHRGAYGCSTLSQMKDYKGVVSHQPSRLFQETSHPLQHDGARPFHKSCQPGLTRHGIFLCSAVIYRGAATSSLELKRPRLRFALQVGEYEYIADPKPQPKRRPKQAATTPFRPAHSLRRGQLFSDFKVSMARTPASKHLPMTRMLGHGSCCP